jgi:hypothetical protein
MKNFTLKRLKSFKSLFFVVLFFVFIPVKADTSFAATFVSPFLQGIYLKKYTATSFASIPVTVCKAEWLSCVALCQNNCVSRIDSQYNDLWQSPFVIKSSKYFSVSIIKTNVSVERKFVFKNQILNNFI